MVKQLGKEWIRGPGLIKKSIEQLNLNLDDLVVITELASGSYIYTPFIAAIAGAEKVYAIVKDSSYAPAEQVSENARNILDFLGKNNIEIVLELSPTIISEADIITNQGFVRPINMDFISNMKNSAVVPLMCETWEYREEDIDIRACKEKGVPVLGTNESASDLNVFDYCGMLALKMCLDAGLEVKSNKIAIYSDDKFGPVIEKSLLNNEAEVHLFGKMEDVDADFISSAEGIITAQYVDPENIFYHKSMREALKRNPYLKVIQYTGVGDLTPLIECNIPYFPSYAVEKHRMAYTLSDLGPKPLILLNAGGLKVGEIMARFRRDGYSREEAIMKSLSHPICQDFLEEQKRRYGL